MGTRADLKHLLAFAHSPVEIGNPCRGVRTGLDRSCGRSVKGVTVDARLGVVAAHDVRQVDRVTLSRGLNCREECQRVVMYTLRRKFPSFGVADHRRYWYPSRGSNPHTLRYCLLRAACLPNSTRRAGDMRVWCPPGESNPHATKDTGT